MVGPYVAPSNKVRSFESFDNYGSTINVTNVPDH